MYTGAACECGLRFVAKNSNGTVIVGVFPCTQLAGEACGCGLLAYIYF